MHANDNGYIRVYSRALAVTMIYGQFYLRASAFICGSILNMARTSIWLKSTALGVKPAPTLDVDIKRQSSKSKCSSFLHTVGCDAWTGEKTLSNNKIA